MPSLGQSLRYKLQEGLLGKESGAQGCKVVVSMKFVDGLMVHSGDPVDYYVDAVVLHVLPRKGVLGIKDKTCCPGTQVVRSTLFLSLCLIMQALWNQKMRSCQPPPSQNRRVGSLSHLPYPSQWLPHNRVLAAAWRLDVVFVL